MLCGYAYAHSSLSKGGSEMEQLDRRTVWSISTKILEQESNSLMMTTIRSFPFAIPGGNFCDPSSSQASSLIALRRQNQRPAARQPRIHIDIGIGIGLVRHSMAWQNPSRSVQRKTSFQIRASSLSATRTQPGEPLDACMRASEELQEHSKSF